MNFGTLAKKIVAERKDAVIEAINVFVHDVEYLRLLKSKFPEQETQCAKPLPISTSAVLERAIRSLRSSLRY